MQPTDVVLCSGGLDSTVVVAELVKSRKNPTLFFCNIGASASLQELAAIKRIAKYFALPLVQVFMYLPFLNNHAMFKIGRIIYSQPLGFKLTSSEENVYRNDWHIPLRNLLLLSAAASYCEYVAATTLYTGFNSPGGVSRDAQDNFTQTFGKMLPVVSERVSAVKVVAPLQTENKIGTVKRGIAVNAPFAITFSCYNGFKKSCGMCPACHSRLLAFKALNIPDPAPYYTKKELSKKVGKKFFDSIMPHYESEGLEFFTG